MTTRQMEQTPTPAPTQESTSPSPQAEGSRRISKEEIAALYSKPEDEWTEADCELLCKFNAQEAEDERKRDEARKAAEAEQRAKIAAYWEKVRRQEEAQKNDGTIAWFMQGLNRITTRPQAYRITEHQAMVPQYLEAAYRMEVERRGGTYQADEYTRAAIITISRWLTSHQKPGLMLRGYIGIGKTTMLLAIKDVMNVLLQESIQIVDARKVAALGRDGAGQLKALAEKRLLGIDDLGTEPSIVKSYGNELSPVGELLTDRYAAQRFTIITTNLTIKVKDGKEIDELQEVYGDRLFDRFHEMFNQVHYDANQQSYRK